jgi:hypothetical protein
VDPITKDYPDLTPYQFSGNTPIQATDLDGAETYLQRLQTALRNSAQMKILRADKIKADAQKAELDKWKPREMETIKYNKYTGINQIGPISVVESNIKASEQQYVYQLGEAIIGGPFAAGMYLLSDDAGAFKGAAVDGVMMLFGGIPAEKSSVFPHAADIKPGRFVPSVEAMRSGRLTIEPGGKFSQSEINAANYMKGLGNDVILRSPQGTRAEGKTSDLLVNGVNYDVYTPESASPDRIISSMAKKNSQTTGIVLDLSKTSVTVEQLGNVLKRVQGTGAKNIKDIVVMPKK